MTKRRSLPVPSGPGSYERVPGFECEGYNVTSHSDDPMPGRTPPTAVILALRLRLDDRNLVLGLRLKSRAAVDLLIDILERHAVDVWPKHKE